MRAPDEARALARADTAGGSALGARDRGDLVLAWLIKLSVTLAVIGLLLFDGVSIVVAKVGVQDDASLAAREAADAADRGADVQGAYDAAVEALADQASPSVVETSTFTIAPDGSATVTTTRTASTFFLKHIGLLDEWVKASATATAAPVR
jgi:hypothetical protein